MRTTANIDLQIMFGKHFVAMSWLEGGVSGFPNGLPRIASGFIAKIKDYWIYVTAGHILEEIDQHKSDGRFSNFRLHDSWTKQAIQSMKHLPIPFDYYSCNGGAINEEGHDFGFFVLPQNTRDLLKTNGVVPLLGEFSYPQGDFQSYWLLGTPAQTIAIISENSIEYNPILFIVEKLNSPPYPGWEKGFPRFFGRVDLSADSLTDIGGVSGGPIFGVRHNEDNVPQTYRLVAIQSTWSSRSGAIAGYYVNDLGTLIKDIIENEFGL